MMLFCPATGRECQSSGCASVMKSCDYWPKAVPTNDRYAEGFKAGRERGMREAAEIADPGKMPCDCIKQSPYPNGPFHSCDCFCGNSGDIRDTANWCALKNARTAILAAIGEKHD